MRKTLTAGLTALSMILVPAAPVQAQDNSDRNRAIIGLLAAGAIGLAIKNSNDKRSTSSSSTQHSQAAPRQRVQDVQTINRHARQQQQTQRQRRVDLVPGRCFRRVETARGGHQNVFTKACLDRRYRDASTLPRQCLVRIGGRNGSNRGYEASCLRDFGYRSDRRWN